MGATRVYSWTIADSVVTFRVSAASDTGNVRALNEDSMLAVPPIFLVADGMGGHAFGDRASQAVARVLETALAGDVPVRPEAVLGAVREANVSVREIADDDFAGTTVAGLAFVQDAADSEAYWMAFNVGDSRIYRWDGDVLEQLSVDHSAVQELLDEGAIGLDDIAGHPERNVITRAIGADETVEPDVWLLPTGGAQSFLICSDGLTKELDDSTIREVLAMPDAPESPADRLISAALASGGMDNVTAVVVEALAVSRGPAPESAIPAHLEETLPRA